VVAADLSGRRWLVLASALLAGGIAVLAASLMSVSTAHGILVEGGPVETVSALVQVATALTALWLMRRHRGLFGLIALAAALMAARELDLHHAFTTHGIFSAKEFSRPEVPLAEKLLAGFALALVLAALVWTPILYRREIARLVRERAAAIWGIGTIVLLLPVLKMFDSLPRILRELGMPLGDEGLKYLLALEEIGELAIPFLLCVVMAQLVLAVRRDETAAMRSLSRRRPA
jgi:hypothetical protein